MQGVVFFGHQTLDTRNWSDESVVEQLLSKLKSLIDFINESGYARVSIPENWYDETLSFKSFWETIEELFSAKVDLQTYIYTSLFDSVFNQCIDKGRTFSSANTSLVENNPDPTALEYFGVIKGEMNWKGIPHEYHIQEQEDLFKFALFFLTQHPFSEESYAGRCKSMFSNLIFHEDFDSTLKGHGKTSEKSKYSSAPVSGILGFSEPVTKSLIILNDIKLDNRSTQEILAEISARSGFECTVQGSNKSMLRFETNLRAPNQKLNCEFHVKINHNNINDGVYYQDRIYFGFAQFENSKKIFIAHSGKHL